MKTETLGRITIAAGGLGVVRLIPELVVIGTMGPKHFYWFIVAADIFLCLIAINQGIRLSRPQRTGSWAGVIFVWTSLSTNALAVFLSILPLIVGKGDIAQGRASGEFSLLLPRMLFYLLVMAAGPGMLWTLLTRPEPGRPAVQGRWIASIAGVLAGGGYACLIMLLHFVFRVLR